MNIKQIFLATVTATIAAQANAMEYQGQRKPYATRSQSNAQPRQYAQRTTHTAPGFINHGIIQNTGSITIQTPSFVNNGAINNEGQFNVVIPQGYNHQPMHQQQAYYPFQSAPHRPSAYYIPTAVVFYPNTTQAPIIITPQKQRILENRAKEERKQPEIAKGYLQKLNKISQLEFLPYKVQSQLDLLSKCSEAEQCTLAVKTYKDLQENSDVQFAKELDIQKNDFISRPQKETAPGVSLLTWPHPDTVKDAFVQELKPTHIKIAQKSPEPTRLHIAPWNKDFSNECEQLGLTQHQLQSPTNWNRLIAII